jgi:hypothetical protein
MVVFVEKLLRCVEECPTLSKTVKNEDLYVLFVYAACVFCSRAEVVVFLTLGAINIRYIELCVD